MEILLWRSLHWFLSSRRVLYLSPLPGLLSFTSNHERRWIVMSVSPETRSLFRVELSIYPSPTPDVVLVETPSALENKIGDVCRPVCQSCRESREYVQGWVSKWIEVEHAIESEYSAHLQILCSWFHLLLLRPHQVNCFARGTTDTRIVIHWRCNSDWLYSRSKSHAYHTVDSSTRFLRCISQVFPSEDVTQSLWLSWFRRGHSFPWFCGEALHCKGSLLHDVRENKGRHERCPSTC